MKRLCISNYWANAYKRDGETPEKVTTLFYRFLKQLSEPVELAVRDEDTKTIKFLVTIRTDLTNEVIVPTDGKFFTNCTAYYPDEHPLDDMVLLSAQNLVLKLFDCGELLPMFIQRTTVYPVGACIVNDEPYVYVNVVIDHTLLDEPQFNLKDCEVVSIKDLAIEGSLEESLLNSLAIVKGESENVDHDNQG